MEYLKYLIEAIMDAIEEFFSALTAPSTTFTFYAFLVSLGFVGWSLIALFAGLPSFVNWDEAVTCSVLLLIIVLIDTSARNSIKGTLSKIKGVTNKVNIKKRKANKNEEMEEV